MVRGAARNPVRLGGDKRSVSSRTSDSLVVPLEPERPKQTVTMLSVWMNPHRTLRGPGHWPAAATLTDGQGHGPGRRAARPRPTLSGQKAGWRVGFPGVGPEQSQRASLKGESCLGFKAVQSPC